MITKYAYLVGPDNSQHIVTLVRDKLICVDCLKPGEVAEPVQKIDETTGLPTKTVLGMKEGFTCERCEKEFLLI